MEASKEETTQKLFIGPEHEKACAVLGDKIYRREVLNQEINKCMQNVSLILSEAMKLMTKKEGAA